MYKFLLLIFSIALTLPAKAQIFKTYRPGHYYDNSGKKIIGLMDFNPYSYRFFFKPDANGSSEKIKIDQVSAVVARRGDSLTVMTEDNKPNKKYFAKFWMATPTMRFYYKYKFIPGPGPSMSIVTSPVSGARGSSQSLSNTLTWQQSSSLYPSTKMIPMYQEGNTTFEITKSNFIEVLSKAFADVPDVVKRIQNKELKFKNLEETFSEYRNKTQYYSE
jgi:hypothetical protein